MINHYLHNAWRHYVRYKYSTIANVLCLAFGITCFLCAYSVFAIFQSAESGFSNSNRIYTIKTQVVSPRSNGTWFAGVPYRMIKYFKSELTEVEAISTRGGQMSGPQATVTLADGRRDQASITMVDQQFFKLFDIRFLRGDRNTALSTPDGVVLGKNVALRFFDSIDVIGKSLTINNDKAVTVTGVTDALPAPTHLTSNRSRSDDGKYYLEIITSMQTMKALSRASSPSTKADTESAEDSRNANSTPGSIVYLLLPQRGVDLDALNAKLQSILEHSVAGRKIEMQGEQITYKVAAIPIKEMAPLMTSLLSTYLGVPILSMITFFGTVILLAAILNYVNVSTTQAIASQRELGIQRLLGATRKHIVIQASVETFLICLVATALGIGIFKSIQAHIVKLTLGFVDFQASWLAGWRFAIAVTLSLIAVTLLAAFYPMLRVARATPIDSIRSTAHRLSSRVLSQVLVATQFAIAGTLLFVMTAVQQQAMELEHTAVGNLSDPVVFVKQASGPPRTLGDAGVDYKTLAAQLARHKGIKEVALVDGNLWSARAIISAIPTGISTTKDKGSKKLMIGNRSVSSNYFAAMNIDLLAGKTFDSALDAPRPQSTAAEHATVQPEVITKVVVGHSVVKALGYKNPQEIVDQTVYDHRGGEAKPLRVIGVAADHFEGYDGAHNAGPIYFPSHGKGQPIIQIEKVDTKATLEEIKQTWKALAPNVPIELKFANQEYRSWLRLYSNFTDPLAFLMTAGIAIAVMGMVAIASHTLRRRTREIAIRKSLGASSRDVFTLLLKDFAIPVVAAVVLFAWPIGWMLSREFISWFPYRATLGPWPFLVSLLSTVLIAWLAISLQSFKAARRKPAEVLRDE